MVDNCEIWKSGNLEFGPEILNDNMHRALMDSS